MNNKPIALFALLASSITTASVTDAKEQARPAKPVEVVNEPGVTVENTVGVDVLNQPTVEIKNGPDNPASVKIENTTSEPIPVIDASGGAAYPRQPFFLRVEKSGGGLSVDYAVPSDKVLVIEAVNVAAYNIPCGRASHQITLIRPDGVTAINALEINLVIAPLVDLRHCLSGQKDMGAHISTRMYARPNDELLVVNAVNALQSVVTLSGYLVPSDSPSLAP